MVVAVVAVLVVQMVVNQVVRVVSVRDRRMSAVGAVTMVLGMLPGTVIGRATIGIRAVDGNDVVVHTAGMNAMQVAFVEVAGMTVVGDGRMTAASAVSVRVAARVLFVSMGAGDNDRRHCDKRASEVHFISVSFLLNRSCSSALVVRFRHHQQAGKLQVTCIFSSCPATARLFD